jgi:hypothetical protein
VNPEGLTIIIHDIPKDSWARAGILAIDRWSKTYLLNKAEKQSWNKLYGIVSSFLYLDFRETRIRRIVMKENIEIMFSISRISAEFLKQSWSESDL